jgi:hypothetical protein
MPNFHPENTRAAFRLYVWMLVAVAIVAGLTFLLHGVP